MTTPTVGAPRLHAFEDAELLRLAEAHGTPAFLYRGVAAESQVLRLREVLPPRVRLAYAVKANPHPVLLRRLQSLGLSFDCASEGELRKVAALGLAPGRIFYAGPGKRDRELAQALRLGARVQAEGWEDLARLDALAAGPVDVNVRVHPLHAGEETTRILGGGGPSAFGVDEEDLAALLDRARELRHVRIRGLHCFTASNQRDAAKLLSAHAAVLAVAKGMHDRGIRLEQIDLGGGLGVPYGESESPLDLEALGEGLAKLLAANPWFTGELILEPGRFLAAPTGVYVARVIRLKESRGTRFAILEGGVNHLLRPLLTGQPFPVTVPGRRGAPWATTLAGPLCTSLDRLGEVALPADLAPGDLVAFGMVGAYGFTEAMTHFLSHPVPPEVWVD